MIYKINRIFKIKEIAYKTSHPVHLVHLTNPVQTMAMNAIINELNEVLAA